jgi:hypothetical protein
MTHLLFGLDGAEDQPQHRRTEDNRGESTVAHSGPFFGFTSWWQRVVFGVNCLLVSLMVYAGVDGIEHNIRILLWGVLGAVDERYFGLHRCLAWIISIGLRFVLWIVLGVIIFRRRFNVNLKLVIVTASVFGVFVVYLESSNCGGCSSGFFIENINIEEHIYPGMTVAQVGYLIGYAPGEPDINKDGSQTFLWVFGNFKNGVFWGIRGGYHGRFKNGK